MTSTRWCAALCVAALALGGCASPSRTDADYRSKAANTAETTRGVIASVQVALQALDRKGVPAPFLSVTLNEAEDDAASAAATFDSIQPPSSAADSIRDELDAILTDTGNTLSDLRIAVRRGELSRLSDLAKPLKVADKRLEHVAALA